MTDSQGRQGRMPRQQQEQQQQTGQAERPYRSHLRPACVPCRRRKSRCQTEADSDSCLTCRAHRTECFFPGESVPPRATHPGRGQRRRSQLPTASHDAAAARTQSHSATTRTAPVSTAPAAAVSSVPPSQHGGPVSVFNSGEEESPLTLGARDDQQLNLHIVGPAVTNDSQVLSDYLSGIPGATRSTRMIIPEPASSSRSVLFTMVQKRPVGLPVNRSPSAEKLAIIEKILEPHIPDLIDE